MISLVAAMSRNRLIGNHGKLPWGKTMANDIQRYLDVIDGKTIVMGANTYFGADHARDKSKIAVLSRSDLDLPQDVEQVQSIEDIKQLEARVGEVVVTGGGQVFKLMIEHADRIYLTVVKGEFEGDVYFPVIDEVDWRIIEQEAFESDENNKYDYEFITYEKKK